jgi:hypothetical protein
MSPLEVAPSLLTVGAPRITTGVTEFDAAETVDVVPPADGVTVKV